MFQGLFPPPFFYRSPTQTEEELKLESWHLWWESVLNHVLILEFVQFVMSWELCSDLEHKPDDRMKSVTWEGSGVFPVLCVCGRLSWADLQLRDWFTPKSVWFTLLSPAGLSHLQVQRNTSQYIVTFMYMKFEMELDLSKCNCKTVSQSLIVCQVKVLKGMLTFNIFCWELVCRVRKTNICNFWGSCLSSSEVGENQL